MQTVLKNKINIINRRVLVGLAIIAALCFAAPVHAGAGKPPQSNGKGSHGGSGSGGSGSGGTFYPTASSVSELIADISYADSTGGVFTINLAPGTNFYITSLNNSTDGGNALPVVGGTKTVNLTIICNGDTIEGTRFYTKTGFLVIFQLFDVAAGSSLTLDDVTLEHGTASAVLNQGTLNIINGSTVWDNSGGGLDNAGGTMTISNSIVTGNYAGDGGGSGGDIYNYNGTVTISGSTVSDGSLSEGGSGAGIFNNGGAIVMINSGVSNNACEGGNGGAGIYNAGGTLAISGSTFQNNDSTFFFYDGRGGFGGAIYNSGGTVTIDNSTFSNNSADQDGGAIDNAGGTLTVNHSIFSGNAAPGISSADSYNFPGLGGGIYNGGTVTVENYSQITGNPDGGDVYNAGALYEDGSSVIGFIYGNAAILF